MALVYMASSLSEDGVDDRKSEHRTFRVDQRSPVSRKNPILGTYNFFLLIRLLVSVVCAVSGRLVKLQELRMIRQLTAISHGKRAKFYCYVNI